LPEHQKGLVRVRRTRGSRRGGSLIATADVLTLPVDSASVCADSSGASSGSHGIRRDREPYGWAMAKKKSSKKVKIKDLPIKKGSAVKGGALRRASAQ